MVYNHIIIFHCYILWIILPAHARVRYSVFGHVGFTIGVHVTLATIASFNSGGCPFINFDMTSHYPLLSVGSQGGSKSELPVFTILTSRWCAWDLEYLCYRTDNSGAVAGAVIGTLLGLVVLAGVIVGVIFIVRKQQKNNNYTPPSQPSGVKTKAPSVKVVGSGNHNAGHHTPSSSFTPSAPPSYNDVMSNKKSSVPSRPPPPKPVSRPPPPKPQSHAPPTKPPPPVNRPAVKPHPAAPSASKPPPQGETKTVHFTLLILVMQWANPIKYQSKMMV